MTRDAIEREWIVSRIPHQGAMCLLDGVESWDEQNIVCRAGSHRAFDNPLRAQNSLGIANAIEYAAQAMAVHGALLIEEKIKSTGAAIAPQSGYLTSVRQVNWHRARFDDIDTDLRVRANRLSGNDVHVLYAFEIHAGDMLLIDGRASVVLNAAELQSRNHE